MLNWQSEGGVLSLVWNGRTLLTSSAERPFVTALRREKSYTAVRGTVKTEVTETARVPLVDAREEGGAMLFTSGEHVVAVRAWERAGGATLHLKGEDGWAYTFCLPADEDEAVFGGGEQYRKVNLRGEQVVNFVSEHIKASTIVEKALLPSALYREKKHSEIGSYAPMPVFVTDRRRLILFDTTADGRSDFTEDDRFSFAFDSCPESLTLLYGGSYEELSRLLTLLYPNRQYLPGWCHEGMILSIQGGTQTILDKCFAMLDAGAKICGVWSQDWSGEKRTVMGKQVNWNWEVDETLYPDLRGAIEKLNARGVRFLGYINPYLVKGGRLYEHCREQGWLITKTDGSVYHIKSTTFDAGMLDLTNPDAVRYIKEVLIGQNMLALGMSGWMADFGEYLPVDCVLHDGDPAKRLAGALGEDQPRGRRGVRREGRAVLHALGLSRRAELGSDPLERRPAHRPQPRLRHALRDARELLAGLLGRDYGPLRHRRLLLLRQDEARRRALHPLDGDGGLLPAHAQP